MTGFKSLLSAHRNIPDGSNVSVSLDGATLSLRFDSRDVIIAAGYSGPTDLWMASLCEILKDMTLSEARVLGLSHWDLVWKEDQFYWDLKLEIADRLFFAPLELLHAALDLYRGREFLYEEESPLICRCFGVREKDVLSFLRTAAEPTLEELSKATKAGMGCRSCVPQLRNWLKIPVEGKNRFYKSKPVADWIELVDSFLPRFPEATPWKMNVESMKGNVVIISYDYDCSQKEEEETGKRLQGFLASSVDTDLAFFLSRSRQR